MVRYLMLVSFVVLLNIDNTAAQNNREPRRNYNNSLYVGGSLLGYDQDGFISPSLCVDYVRYTNKSFSWGLSIAQYLDMFSTSSGARDADRQIKLTLSAMGYYDLPVISDALVFRCGAGIGGGNHIYIKSTDYKDELLQYFVFEFQWIYRTRKGLEFKFSPLVFTPSRLLISPMRVRSPHEQSIIITDFIHFSVGRNF